MTTRERIARLKVAVGLIWIDLALLFTASFLVLEDKRRWPVLLVVGPLLVIINYFGLRRLFPTHNTPFD
jgi:hypothetical protein